MRRRNVSKNSIKGWLKDKTHQKILGIVIGGVVLLVVLLSVLYQTKVAPVNLQKVRIDNTENFYREEGFKTYKDDNAVGKKGIDVSAFQGDIDWKKVKDSGVDFAILRCGFRDSEAGEISIDSRFKEYAEGALGQGIQIGAYFFSQATTKDEAREEAQFTLKTIKNYDIKYPVGFDMEWVSDYDRIDNTSSEDKTIIAKEFCDTIKAEGYETTIYGNKNWLYNQYNLDQLSGYNLWIADYNESSNFDAPVVGWQYNNTGTIYGIKGDVDLDVFFLSTK